MPDMRDFRLINHSVSNVADLFLLDLSCSPMSGSARLLKRLEDIVLSSLILILISPLMVILALGVKLSSPGPVFYRQERVGLNGHFHDAQVSLDADGGREKRHSMGRQKSDTLRKIAA